MIHTKLGDFKIIVIYQYGKVGSSTLGTNICQWLNVKFPGTTMKIMSKYPKVCHVHNPKIMLDIMKKYDSILLINACRNFYHRQISEFFQQTKNKQKIKTMNMSELGESLRNNSIFRLNNWYDNLEKMLGFELNPFDYKKHYSLTKDSKITVILVRLEDSKYKKNESINDNNQEQHKQDMDVNTPKIDDENTVNKNIDYVKILLNQVDAEIDKDEHKYLCRVIVEYGISRDNKKLLTRISNLIDGNVPYIKIEYESD